MFVNRSIDSLIDSHSRSRVYTHSGAAPELIRYTVADLSVGVGVGWGWGLSTVADRVLGRASHNFLQRVGCHPRPPFRRCRRHGTFASGQIL